MNSWMQICDERDTALESELAARVEKRRAKGEYTLDNQLYIRDVNLAITKGDLATSPIRIELLRRLCALHAVDLKQFEITSHRKYIGPYIVAAKKLLFRIIKPLIDPVLRQQRSFNAAVIYMLADLANDCRSEK